MNCYLGNYADVSVPKGRSGDMRAFDTFESMKSRIVHD